MKDQLARFGYLAGWKLIRYLSYQWARAIFNAAADLAVRRGGAGVIQLRANLRRVVPKADQTELNELVRQSMRSYARYWLEVFRNSKAIYESGNLVPTGQENLDAALAQGRGVILALPHSGNWDVGGIWLVEYAGTFTTVVERLKPESLYQSFIDYRATLGFEVLPLTGGDRPVAAVLAERLRANKVVCLLADRDLTAGGVPVSFFGEQTMMPAGPAHLAVTTGAALLPVGCWFTEDGWSIRIHAPIHVAGISDVPAATQSLADVFAADISAHPADWHMMQKLWLADLPDRKQRALRRLIARGAGQSRER